jgi:MFS family permease
LAALVLIAWCGAAVEDGGSAWSALYMSETLEVTPALAGLGFVAMIGMQFLGRVMGDRTVDRYGQRTIAQTGALLTLCGTGGALLVPMAVTTIVGFGAAGLGIATLVPAVIHAANEIPGLRPGTGLALMNWLMRAGSLGVPPFIGAVADIAGLRTGLLVLPASAVVVLAASFVLPSRRSAPAPDAAITAESRP